MSGMDSGHVEGPDVSNDLGRYSRLDEPWDSTKFQIWWSGLQNSLVVERSLSPKDWRYLMTILTNADVSRIEHLVVNLPCGHAPVMENYYGELGTIYGLHGREPIRSAEIFGIDHQLGHVLFRRKVSTLKTLRILASTDLRSDGLGIEYLARAVREGSLINLRSLSLPGCIDVTDLLKALAEFHIPQLTSFSLSFERAYETRLADARFWRLDQIFESGCFKGLHHLDLSHVGGSYFWEYLTGAIKSENLPSITSLRLGDSLIGAELADFARDIEKWFASLENLALDGCRITSKIVCSLVDVVMEFPINTKLALKSLDLHTNRLGSTAVAALGRLADSDRLPQLQNLDLSGNKSLNKSDGSKSLVDLMRRVQTGSLINLRNLNWKRNKIVDADALAIVKAYYEDQTLITEVQISWFHVRDLSLRTKLKEYRNRNERLVALREKLHGDLRSPLASDNGHDDKLGDFIPLTSAKVFLCGYPGVGKTRLRKTLLRQIGNLRTKFAWETRPRIFREPRTRGIEISRIGQKKSIGQNLTLVMWDLAGQQEYHILHGTFLADLGFQGGKATTFILVFKAPFKAHVEARLLYWLRFAASSSLKHVKRQVVIVLNCFNGRRCPDSELRLWQALIRNSAKLFSDLLDIHPNPFIVDVRKAASVKQLKCHLFYHAQRLLENVTVPKVCFDLQEGLKGWSEGEESNHLPILSWEAFEERWQSWQLKPNGRDLSTVELKIAASYLHEIGEIIYFEEKAISEASMRRRSVLVPNPEWFCRKVVGELLLPKEMLEGRSSVKVSADGSISVVMFQAFFEHLLEEGTHTDDVISMLELVGLCYRKGKENIIVPALIHEDDYQSINWDGGGLQWVMGRALTVEDKGRNVMPMTLFRRLQVDLALNPKFGGRGDSDYIVGKSFSSFKVGELLVLIQFDVDHSDPTDDRIDILVKSLRRTIKRGLEDVTSAQVKCVCEVMQKLEDLCVSCCPGMAYDIKVIEPLSAATRVDKMSERKLMSLKEIKDLLIGGDTHLSWHRDGHHMKLKTFLSDSEVKELLGSKTVKKNPNFAQLMSLEMAEATNSSLEAAVEQESYNDFKQDVLTMGLLTEYSLQKLEEANEEDCSNATDPRMTGAVGEDRVDTILHAIQDAKQTLRKEIHCTRKLVDVTRKEVLLAITQKQAVLVRHIQEQQTFSIQERERSVPRYMFLSKKQGKSRVWISLTEAFRSTFHLHLLCEAHFENGFLHEVEPQEGIKLKKPKKWLLKVSPWLRRSLQVAIMVGKTAGNVYLPGVFNLIPDYNVPNEEGALAKAVDSAATILLEEDGEFHQNHDVPGHCGSAAQPVNVNERLIAQEVIKDLISEVGHVEFATKIRLRRVLLRTTVQQQAGSSQQTEGSVLWICNDCCKRYGNRVTAI